MLTGGCLCGGIQFQVVGQPNKIQLCHCQQCRKAQGGPFAANLAVNTDDFTIVKGEEFLSEFESQTIAGKIRIFCRCCGSPIISKLDSSPGVVRVRVGTLDEPFASDIALHQFVAYKAQWWDITDELPKYDEARPKK